MGTEFELDTQQRRREQVRGQRAPPTRCVHEVPGVTLPSDTGCPGRVCTMAELPGKPPQNAPCGQAADQAPARGSGRVPRVFTSRPAPAGSQRQLTQVRASRGLAHILSFHWLLS